MVGARVLRRRLVGRRNSRHRTGLTGQRTTDDGQRNSLLGTGLMERRSLRVELDRMTDNEARWSLPILDHPGTISAWQNPESKGFWQINYRPEISSWTIGFCSHHLGASQSHLGTVEAGGSELACFVRSYRDDGTHGLGRRTRGFEPLTEFDGTTKVGVVEFDLSSQSFSVFATDPLGVFCGLPPQKQVYH
ncbi:hypothetical protein MA16_Dca009874 [Dendrobium catenatum]|uniref:Uncharacterized protein n=1 Tax=Dendrobium catenatum TaxID=906689 RepID=A0A2I0VKE0_9ASPA|nr:hypothetical protein MA16_Dca009874 [Dendrobium catenatum]